MHTAHRRTRPLLAGLAGLTLVGALGVSSPALADGQGAPATPAAAQAEPDPHWDSARCTNENRYGTQSRRILFTNTSSRWQTYTYWVDGIRLGTISLPPDSGAFRFSMPPVPPGSHLWQLTKNDTSAPSGTGAWHTSPPCPSPPPPYDPPEPGQGAPRANLVTKTRQPQCQMSYDGNVVAKSGTEIRNEDPDREVGVSVWQNTDTEPEQYVVPPAGGVLTADFFEPNWSPGTYTTGLGHVHAEGAGWQDEGTDVDIPSCSADFGIARNASVITLGGWFTASVSGAMPGEELVMTISGVEMRTKNADSAGRAKMSVRIPEGWAASSRTVRVEGSNLPNRDGVTSIRTVR